MTMWLVSWHSMNKLRNEAEDKYMLKDLFLAASTYYEIF